MQACQVLFRLCQTLSGQQGRDGWSLSKLPVARLQLAVLSYFADCGDKEHNRKTRNLGASLFPV